MDGRGESLVVIGVMMNNDGRLAVRVIGLVPRAHGACQYQQDRQGGERLRAKSHLT
jgi:hypothetical protein